MAFFIPGLAIITDITGVVALVVHDALDVILSSFRLSMPILGVAVGVVSSLAGAVMTTLLAPASRWGVAFSWDSKTPVDSMTTSIFKSFQGSLAGSFS